MDNDALKAIKEHAKKAIEFRVYESLTFEILLRIFKEILSKEGDPVVAYTKFIANWKEKIRAEEYRHISENIKDAEELLPPTLEFDFNEPKKENLVMLNQAINTAASDFYKRLFEDEND